MTLGWPWSILRQGQILVTQVLFREKWTLFILSSPELKAHRWAYSIAKQPIVKIFKHLLLLKTFKHLLLWNNFETTEPIKAKFHGAGETRVFFFQEIQVTWPRSPPQSYLIKKKTFKNLLQNQWADCNETCNVALRLPVYHSLFKLWPRFDLGIFYATVKFGRLGFYVGKKWKWYIFRKLLKPVISKLVDALN